MNDVNGGKIVDLAEAVDFALGSVAVHPSTREIVNGSAREVVEPRVMQVLVALARRQGQVVSRDSLVEMCWGGRAVGEDAIQRCIAKLRKLAESSGAFAIDTVARVGYRLRVDAQASVPARGAADEPVLAVLPFDNLSDDREMQFFSDGVSEEILHAIARAKGLKVIGRMSAFQFRGARKPEAARELGVTHILDGSVRRSGDRIRISAQLVEADGRTSIWNEQFDRNISDVLEVQAEIARLISNALQANLAARGSPVVDPEAYSLFLRARQMRLAGLADEYTRDAIPLLERCVALAPSFARAWGSLAQARAGIIPRDRDYVGAPAHDAAVAAAQRALQLDATTSEALIALAMLKPAFSEYAEKIELTRKALEVVPGDPFASMYHAGGHVSVGRARDAMPHNQRAMTLEPASPIFAFTYCLSLATWNVERAVDMTRELRRTFPRSSEILLLNSMVLQRAGFSDEALAHVQAANLDEMGITGEEAGVFRLISWLGTAQFDERMNGLRALLAANADDALWIGLCKFAAEFGAPDLAYQQLFEALDKRRPLTARGTRSMGLPRFIQSAGFFQCDGLALRRDSRFAALCARIGLVDYWTSSGHWPDCADEVPYDFRAECGKAAAELGRA